MLENQDFKVLKNISLTTLFFSVTAFSTKSSSLMLPIKFTESCLPNGSKKVCCTHVLTNEDVIIDTSHRSEFDSLENLTINLFSFLVK